MRALAIACVLALTVFGCKKEEAQQTEATPVPAPSAATPTQAAVATETAAADNDIPTVEDFEEEAAEDITPDNLEEELDKLEKEIGG